MNKMIFASQLNPSHSSVLIVNEGTTWASFTNDLSEQLQLQSVTYLELFNSLEEVVGTRISNMEEFFAISKLWDEGMIFRVSGEAKDPSAIVNFQQAIAKDFASSLQSIVAGLSRLETSETDDMYPPLSTNARQSMASLKTSAEMELDRQREEEAKKRLQASEDSRRLREILESEKRQSYDSDSRSTPSRVKSSGSIAGGPTGTRGGGGHGAEDSHHPGLPSVSYSTDEDCTYLKSSLPAPYHSHSDTGDHDSPLRSTSFDDEEEEWIRAEEQRAKHKAREVERQKRVQMISNQRRNIHEETNGKPANPMFAAAAAESVHHVGGSRLRAMGGVKLLMKKPLEISFKSFKDPRGELVTVSVEDQADWIALTTAVGVYLNIEPTQITHFVLIDEDGDEASGKIGDCTKFWKFFDRYTSVAGRSFAVHFIPDHKPKHHPLPEATAASTTAAANDAPSLLNFAAKKGTSAAASTSPAAAAHPTHLPPKAHQPKTESYLFRLSTDYIDERVLIPLPHDCDWKTLTDNLLTHLNIPKASRDSTHFTRISLFDEDGDEIAGPFETDDKFWKAARSRYDGTTVFVAAIENANTEPPPPTAAHTSAAVTKITRKENSKVTATASAATAAASAAAGSSSEMIYFYLPSHLASRVALSIPHGSTWEQINDLVMSQFKQSGKEIASLTLSDEEDEVFGGIHDERKFWKSVKSFYQPEEMKYVIALKDAPIKVPMTTVPCRLSSETAAAVKLISIPLLGTWEQIKQAISSEYHLQPEVEVDFIELVDSDGDVFGTFHSEKKFWKTVKTTAVTSSSAASAGPSSVSSSPTDMVYVITTKTSKTSPAASAAVVAPTPVVPPRPTMALNFRLSTESESQQSSVPIPLEGSWTDISEALLTHYRLSSESSLLHLDFKDSDGDDIIKAISSDKKFWKAVKLSQSTGGGTFVATVQAATPAAAVPSTSVVSASSSSTVTVTKKNRSKEANADPPSPSFSFALSHQSDELTDVTLATDASWESIESALISSAALKLSPSQKLESLTLFDDDRDPLFEHINNANKFWKAVSTRYRHNKGMFFVAKMSPASASASHKGNAVTSRKATAAAVPVPVAIPTTPFNFRLEGEDESASHEIAVPQSGDWKQISETLIRFFQLPSQTSIDRIDLIDEDGDLISADITTDKKFWKIAQKGYMSSMVFVVTRTIPILSEPSSAAAVPTIAIFCRLSTDHLDDKAVANIPEDGTWEDIVDCILHSLGTSHSDELDHLDLIDHDGDEIFGMISNEKKFWKAFNHRYDPNADMVFVVTLGNNSNGSGGGSCDFYDDPMASRDAQDSTANAAMASIPSLPFSFTLSPQLTDIFTISIPEDGSWETVSEAIAFGLDLDSTETVSSLQLIDLDGDDVFSKIIDAKKFWKAALQKYIPEETVFLVHPEPFANSTSAHGSSAHGTAAHHGASHSHSHGSSSVFIPSALPLVDPTPPVVSIYKKNKMSNSQQQSQFSPNTSVYQLSVSDMDSSTRSHGSGSDPFLGGPTNSSSNTNTNSVSIYKKKIVATHTDHPHQHGSAPTPHPPHQHKHTEQHDHNSGKYSGRFVEVDCKLSSEGLDRIIVVSLPAMGTWEQIIETLSNAFELSSSSTIDRIELLDNDDAPVAMNIVSSSKFWKACLELYQESDTYFNLYVVTVPHQKQRHNSHSAGGSTQTSSAASSSYSSYKTSAPAPLSPAPVPPPPVTGGATLSPGGARQANDIANFLAACGDGDLEAVSDYLQRGYDVNLKDDSNLTGLHIACIHGHQKIVQFLVDKEASITCRDLDGMTPLHFACENNHTAVAIYLVRMGGDTSLRNRAGLTSLHYICLCGNMQLTVLIRDYLINVATGTGLTLLHCAADQGHYDLMNYLIEHSAQISPRDDEGLTPLHLSVINGHLHCVKLLIEHGAYWNVRDDTGMSPLLHACHEGNMEMVEYLLHPQVGGNVLARNDNGDTALHLATSAGSLDLVKFLLTRKVEINARNKSGETALGVAMQAGFDHLVSWLRDRGATNKAESREEASTREKVDNKTETAARAFEAEEMLNLQRELEAAAKRR